MTSGVYGLLPERLGLSVQAATQFSPLIPGSASLESTSGRSFDEIVMLAPPGTLERRYAVALALLALVPNAALTVLALKDKGGARLGDELRHFGCDVSETAKHHYRICTAVRPAAPVHLDAAVTEGGLHFLDGLGLWSQPGVFSWDRIDAGSALLIEQLPDLAGRGADFGCGIGFLSKAALRSPKVQELTLIDIDRRAIEAAKRNVADERARFLWADLLHMPVERGSLDFVVMNPPFHGGGIEDRSLGQRCIERAAEALRKGGTLWLTANRHLPYEPVMQPLFRHITRRIEAGGFKVYEAQK